LKFSLYKDGIERDIVQRFCAKHLEKIKRYVNDISKFLPFPAPPSEESINKGINYCEKSPNGKFRALTFIFLYL
jgi:hypothetical protein